MTRAARETPDETRLLVTAAEVQSWNAAARPGDQLVCCIGSRVPEGPTKTYISKLIGAGQVRTHQRRVGRDTEHFMVKRDAPALPREREPVDQQVEAIFAALRRCVDRGRRAYSDLELAKIAGLATRHQARKRVQRLEQAGRIETEFLQSTVGPWRVVTIAGRSTARPPQ